MTKEVQTKQTQEELNDAIMRVVMTGDLAGLTEVQCFQYYNYMCKKAGLDPALSPFEYMKLNGKKVLYAKKGAAEQLRSIHRVSLERMSQDVKLDTILIETKARTPDGRVDTGLGAVSCKGLTGTDLANAFMKAETKSKRRATLSICGLNMLDETEIEDIRSAGGVHPENPPDEDLAENGNNDPFAEPRFTRGAFAKYKPSEKSVEALRRFVAVVEKRLADPKPKKPLDADERKEWEWNVELAAKRIAEVETAPIQDPANFQDPSSFEGFKG
jgi:hypothetical protein